MAQDNCHKIKLLKLLELLRQETDEQHPLPTNAVCSKLAGMGITCDRRTLAKDIYQSFPLRSVTNSPNHSLSMPQFGLQSVCCTEGNRFISVCGINFAACMRTRKSGIDANCTQ